MTQWEVAFRGNLPFSLPLQVALRYLIGNLYINLKLMWEPVLEIIGYVIKCELYVG